MPYISPYADSNNSSSTIVAYKPHLFSQGLEISSPIKVIKAVELYPLNLENYLKFKNKFPGGIYYMILDRDQTTLATNSCIPFITSTKELFNLSNHFNQAELDYVVFGDISLSSVLYFRKCINKVSVEN